MTNFKKIIMVLLISMLTQPLVNADDFVPEQVMCQLLPGNDISDINNTYGTSIITYLSNLDIYLLATLPGQDAESLAEVIEAESIVLLCQANYLIDSPEGVQSSQPFIDVVHGGDFQGQPAAVTLAVDQANTSTTGTAVKVAIIDAGVNLTHPQLISNVSSGFDFIGNDPISQDEAGGISSGHGTFVAGIINLVAPDAEIVAYRVLDTTGRGNGFSVTEAIMQAVDDGSQVINLSMVMNVHHASLDMAIEYARNNNVMVVAAAGNDSLEIERFPARDSYTLSVAAVDSNNIKADFSNFGGKIDVCAPGTQIYSPYLDISFAWWDGSSFAAPFVAAQAALLYAIKPDATWNEIYNAITETAINIDSENPGLEGKLGSGLIDLNAAIAFIEPFICGDVNNDGLEPDISDLVYMVQFMLFDGPPPDISNSTDVNGDNQIDISDLVYFVNYIFADGPEFICQD